MRVFKIKKGGETENVDEVIVVLTKAIDDELLKKAINICAEQNFTLDETIKYIEDQFNCVSFVTFNDLFTFYC